MKKIEKEVRISPSLLMTWRECPARAVGRILRIKEPTTEAQEMGTAYHARVLRVGAVVGGCALDLVEFEAKRSIAENIYVCGYIDGFCRERECIIDIKTTRDKNCCESKLSSYLYSSPQLLMYAYALSEKETVTRLAISLVGLDEQGSKSRSILGVRSYIPDYCDGYWIDDALTVGRDIQTGRYLRDWKARPNRFCRWCPYLGVGCDGSAGSVFDAEDALTYYGKREGKTR